MPLTGAENFRKKMRAFNGAAVAAAPMNRAYRLKLAKEGVDLLDAVRQLNELADVEFAEPNYLVNALADAPAATPDDPYYSLQYGIQDINLPELWGQPVISKEGPVIAILDTGVDINHPDLQANIWTNEAELNGAKGYDDDGNGFVDDLNGWDFVNNSGKIADYNGHGTHCAGIAAACGFNGIGIVGANPFARIMPLTVLQSNGTGDIAAIIKAVDYAAANGASIISMSLGTYAESQALQQALGRAYQKAVIVAAAGNDGYCLNHAHPEKGQPAPAPMFPAAYTFVLGVQASSANGGLAGFSNYDDNGATYSEYTEDKLYNYEVTAPGASIMSTYPNGKYKQLNGTSMATPLVAGALSRLLQAKEYPNKEELFGDLINSVTSKGNLDIAAAYKIKDTDRKPTLSLVTYRLDDEKMGDGDSRPDAGETIRLYPKFRNAWGMAKNITYKLKLAELEDPEIVEFMDNGESHAISNLSSYASVEAESPFIFKINSNCVDGRIIKMILTATCDNISAPLEQELEFTVENGVELDGLITDDLVLSADKNYIVTGNVAIPKNVVVTIEPGTTIRFNNTFNQRIKSEGTIVAKGTPEKIISFVSPFPEANNVCISLDGEANVFEYCRFTNFSYPFSIYLINSPNQNFAIKNCIFEYIHDPISASFKRDTNRDLNPSVSLERCNVNLYGIYKHSSFEPLAEYSNIWSSDEKDKDIALYNTPWFWNNNFVNIAISNREDIDDPAIRINKFEEPNYFGSSVESIVRNNILDFNTGFGFGQFDLSNMRTRPVAQAHGIVWKVVVNGYDAQDEYELLPPLGVGRHKFEVYFNRKMNHDVAPMLAMGVREPYNQTAIAEDGSWRTETFDGEEVDIYTAYLTINGRSNYDGVNRVYVAQAQDDEFFEIPLENVRFNVNVQAAGSLSEGFTAEAGLGRVNLEWDNSEENFDDMLGYNMYRYSVDNAGVASDTIRINTQLLEAQETALTDYDVTPGTTYCYYYKVMRTNMSENAPSKTVAVTPLTSVAGDANGSGDVDVADVITTVNYAAGMEPKPFIFEAADMNADTEIDILDVVGIIKRILNPAAAETAAIEATAIYTIEDGIVYVDTPVDLAGLQLNLEMEKGASVTAAATLDGFEQTGAWIGDNEYIFMAYTLSGKKVAAGVHPVLAIGDAKVKSLKLSDPDGRNVEALFVEDTTGLGKVEAETPSMTGVYNIMGIKLADDAKALERLPRGIYIVDGQKIVK